MSNVDVYDHYNKMRMGKSIFRGWVLAGWLIRGWGDGSIIDTESQTVGNETAKRLTDGTLAFAGLLNRMRHQNEGKEEGDNCYICHGAPHLASVY